MVGVYSNELVGNYLRIKSHICCKVKAHVTPFEQRRKFKFHTIFHRDAIGRDVSHIWHSVTTSDFMQNCG